MSTHDSIGNPVSKHPGLVPHEYQQGGDKFGPDQCDICGGGPANNIHTSPCPIPTPELRRATPAEVAAMRPTPEPCNARLFGHDCRLTHGHDGAHDCTPAPVPPANYPQETGPMDGVWRCQECGDLLDHSTGEWRRDVDRWAHSHGQAGHIEASYFGPEPVAPGEAVPSFMEAALLDAELHGDELIHVSASDTRRYLTALRASVVAPAPGEAGEALEAVKRYEAFTNKVLDAVWSGFCEMQDEALECGVIEQVEGGYNPEIHASLFADVLEPGDLFYMPVPETSPLPALTRAVAERDALLQPDSARVVAIGGEMKTGGEIYADCLAEVKVRHALRARVAEREGEVDMLAEEIKVRATDDADVAAGALFDLRKRVEELEDLLGQTTVFLPTKGYDLLTTVEARLAGKGPTEESRLRKRNVSLTARVAELEGEVAEEHEISSRLISLQERDAASLAALCSSGAELGQNYMALEKKNEALRERVKKLEGDRQ